VNANDDLFAELDANIAERKKPTHLAVIRLSYISKGIKAYLHKKWAKEGV